MNRRQFLRRGGAAAAVSGAAPAVFAMAARAEEPSFKTGFAERDISPEIGMETPGGYGKSYHRKFHDACKVRAAVLDDGKRRVALVGVDALIIPRHIVLAAREDIQKRCGLGPEAVLIGASHSHSSGPVGMVQPGEFDYASAQVRKLAYEESSMADAAYLKRVQQQIVDAVCSADRTRAAARCSFGSGVENRVAYNRRFRMKNGQSWTHPGKGNPDIVEPAGPTDPEVGVIGAWDKNGHLAGCIVNYACHATTSPDGISANWIYYMEQVIRGSLGPGVVVVFLQGFSGDVTQVDNLSPYADPPGEQQARIVGGRIGAEAVKVLLSAAPGEASPLEARSSVLRIPRRVPDPERVRRALEIVQKVPKQVGHTQWIFAKETVLLDAMLQKDRDVEAEVQALQIGPAVFLSAPGEMFCQLGLDIKKGSRFRFTYPVELANGCVGYVPTEEALGPHGGGYETRLTSYTNLEPKAGTRFVEAAIELAQSLTPSKIPEPPREAPFNASGDGIGPSPWSYGNVPPELS